MALEVTAIRVATQSRRYPIRTPVEYAIRLTKTTTPFRR